VLTLSCGKIRLANLVRIPFRFAHAGGPFASLPQQEQTAAKIFITEQYIVLIAHRVLLWWDRGKCFLFLVVNFHYLSFNCAACYEVQHDDILRRGDSVGPPEVRASS